MWSRPARASTRAAPPARGYQEQPLWWDDAGFPHLPAAPLPGEVDVVVVGGGFTGLAAAIRLARSGRRVAVLDARRLGHGASGRNAGMIHAGLRVPATRLERRHGAAGRALHDASVDACRLVAQLAAETAPDSGWAECGWLHLAHRRSRLDALRRAEPERRRNGETTTLLMPDALAAESSCTGFHGGLLTDNGASIHPGRYLAGLARRAAGAGAELHEDSAVTAVDRAGAGFRVRTHRGDVVAGDVLVATNGYTDGAFPGLRRRVIPIGSYVIATEPLDETILAAISPRHRMMSDTRNFLHYWRRSPDGRLVFGGRASFAPVSLGRARDQLYASMVAIYPELAGVSLSHAWMGNVGFTFDRVPHLGRRDGITYAMGYCGSGVAMGTWMGTVAAEWIAGGSEPAFTRLGFPTLPGYAGRPWFLPLAGWYYQLRDRVL